MKPRIEAELQKVLATSNGCSEHQVESCKWIKCPEYLSAYKSNPSDLGFLGGCISSKVFFCLMQVIFGSGGFGFISRQDYNTFGPTVFTTKI